MFYFFERQRVRVCEWGGKGGAERKGVTESKAGSRLWAVSTESDVELELTDCEIMTWAEVRRCTDWATQTPHHMLLQTSPLLLLSLNPISFGILCFISSISTYFLISYLFLFLSYFIYFYFLFIFRGRVCTWAHVHEAGEGQREEGRENLKLAPHPARSLHPGIMTWAEIKS